MGGMSESRYKVVEESTTAHCCFAYTVVDTKEAPDIEAGTHGGAHVCETFRKDSAERIVDALNTLAAIEAGEKAANRGELVDLDDWLAEIRRTRRADD